MNYYVSCMRADRIDDGKGINEHIFTFRGVHVAENHRLASCLRSMALTHEIELVQRETNGTVREERT